MFSGISFEVHFRGFKILAKIYSFIPIVSLPLCAISGIKANHSTSREKESYPDRARGCSQQY